MEVLFIVLALMVVALFLGGRARKPAKESQQIPSDGAIGSPAVSHQGYVHVDPSVIVDPAMFLPGDGSYSFQIVGESHRQDALRLIAGSEEKKGKEHHCDAVLVHEPNNPHDKNACAVTIEGHKVGYVPKDEAKLIVAAMKAKGLSDGFAVGCKAIINGGWISKDGYTGKYGVVLDIDTGFLPVTALQKEMLRYLGRKAPRDVTRSDAARIGIEAKQADPERFAQWEALYGLIEHLHSEDGREEFFEIKKPSIKAIRDAFEHFIREGKSPQQIRDDIDELVEHMIDSNPNLEK